MTVSAAVVLTALTIPAQAADTAGSGTEAVSCYGSARSYSAEAGSGPGDNAHWPNRGHWTSVLGNCNDINIKTNSTRSVRVCTHNKCHGWVKATKGVWTVIFTNSTPDAEYYLQFDGVSTNSGWIAD
ncbi:hypothetical protein OHA98_22190 [Streptomyces sp. NBC_00654]|uniref:hypothetical protein n=1 Tax=Streptomyces sp. NBC_00654 TaxID=2975799 RepID=UPI00224EB46E|nr:hypothetical protein [Streptomyces sp. NBC_00654]MCX4967422.1 hypothetical protein [Streptomyces sp. NBC_00654]